MNLKSFHLPGTEVEALEATPNNSLSPHKVTIILIHGLWMTPASWEDWGVYYTNLGYRVLAPGWPGIDDRTVEDISANPASLQGLTIKAILDHYKSLIAALPEPPILLGHSLGGLFVQVLLSRGLGAAGVGICPAPPPGVLALKLSTVRAGFSILGNPFTYNKKAVPITEAEFHYAFGNHLDAEDSKLLWQKASIPPAAHVLWQGALGFVGKGAGVVGWSKKDRVPLLLIAGTDDHTVPVEVVKAEQKKYRGPATVELKLFQGRTHGIISQDGWEEVVDFAIDWVKQKVEF